MALLQTAGSLFVHLDPRGEEVRVPPWLKKQPQLVLQVGLNMAIPIPDLEVGEDALSCTLSFNRRPEFCRLPWSAVFGLVGDDGRGMIWPESVPPEVAASAEGRATTKKPERKLRLAGAEERPGEAGVADDGAREAAPPAAGAPEGSGAAESPAPGRSAGARRAERSARELPPAGAAAAEPAEQEQPAPKASPPPTGAEGAGAGGTSGTSRRPPWLRVVK